VSFEAMTFRGALCLLLLSMGCLSREIREIADRAESGDSHAMYQWGEYLQTKGLHSYTAWAESIRWYERAAERGNTRAMVKLGNLLLLSIKPDDCRQGYCWYARAALAGDSEAQLGMYKIYKFGNCAREGFPKDAARAAFWSARLKESGERKVIENERRKSGVPETKGSS